MSQFHVDQLEGCKPNGLRGPGSVLSSGQEHQDCQGSQDQAQDPQENRHSLNTQLLSEGRTAAVTANSANAASTSSVNAVGGQLTQSAADVNEPKQACAAAPIKKKKKSPVTFSNYLHFFGNLLGRGRSSTCIHNMSLESPQNTAQGNIAFGESAFGVVNNDGSPEVDASVSRLRASTDRTEPVEEHQSSSDDELEYQEVIVNGKNRLLHCGYLYAFEKDGNKGQRYYRCHDKHHGCNGRGKLVRHQFDDTQPHTCRRAEILQQMKNAGKDIIEQIQYLEDNIEAIFDGPTGKLKNREHEQTVLDMQARTQSYELLLMGATRKSWTTDEHWLLHVLCESRLSEMKILHYVLKGINTGMLSWRKYQKWIAQFRRAVTEDKDAYQLSPISIEKIRLNLAEAESSLASYAGSNRSRSPGGINLPNSRLRAIGDSADGASTQLGSSPNMLSAGQGTNVGQQRTSGELNLPGVRVPTPVFPELPASAPTSNQGDLEVPQPNVTVESLRGPQSNDDNNNSHQQTEAATSSGAATTSNNAKSVSANPTITETSSTCTAPRDSAVPFTTTSAPLPLTTGDIQRVLSGQATTNAGQTRVVTSATTSNIPPLSTSSPQPGPSGFRPQATATASRRSGTTTVTFTSTPLMGRGGLTSAGLGTASLLQQTPISQRPPEVQQNSGDAFVTVDGDPNSPGQQRNGEEEAHARLCSEVDRLTAERAARLDSERRAMAEEHRRNAQEARELEERTRRDLDALRQTTERQGQEAERRRQEAEDLLTEARQRAQTQRLELQEQQAAFNRQTEAQLQQLQQERNAQETRRQQDENQRRQHQEDIRRQRRELDEEIALFRRDRDRLNQRLDRGPPPNQQRLPLDGAQPGRYEPDGPQGLGHVRPGEAPPPAHNDDEEDYEELYHNADLARHEAEEQAQELRQEIENLRQQLNNANNRAPINQGDINNNPDQAGRQGDNRQHGANRGNPGGDPFGDPDDDDDPDDYHYDRGGRNNRGNGGGGRGNRGNRYNRGHNYNRQYLPLREPPVLDPPADWYTTLPPPWNVPPIPDSKADDLTKTITNGSFNKFDGTTLRYLSWRTGFLGAVHRKNITEQAKQQYMAASLDQIKSPYLSTMVNSMLYAPDGYRNVIRHLEHTHGGPDQDKRRYQAQIEDMPYLNPTNMASISDWVMRIQSVQLACAIANPTVPDVTPIILPHISNKMPMNFIIEWEGWINNFARQRTVPSLVDFLRTRQETLRRYSALPITKSNPPKLPTPTRRKQQSNLIHEVVESDIDAQTVHEIFQTFQEEAWNDLYALPDDDVSTDTDEDYAFINQKGYKCAMGCDTYHLLKKCQKFLKLTPRQRFEIIKKQNRCTVCLSKAHDCKPCPKEYKCKHCKGPHHSLLHFEKKSNGDFSAKEDTKRDDRQDPSAGPSSSKAPGPKGLGSGGGNAGNNRNQDTPSSSNANFSEEATSMSVTLCGPQLDENFCLKNNIRHSLKSLRCLPVRLTNPTTGISIITNAMLDECNSHTMIAERIQRLLSLAGPSFKITLQGSGGVETPHQAVYSEVNIANLDGSYDRTFTARIIPSPAGTYQPVDWTKYQKLWPHLAGIPLQKPAKLKGVGIMIGNDQNDLMSSLQEVMGGPNQPCARLTKLGWSVAGPTNPETRMSTYIAIAENSNSKDMPEEYHEYYQQEIEEIVSMMSAESAYDQRYRTFYEEELNDMVRKFIISDLLEEEQETDIKVSNEERYVLNKVKATHRRLQDGRHEIGCSWKRGEPKLINNRKQALVRLEGLEKHPFMQSEDNRQKYADIIQQHLDEGFIEKVPAKDLGRRDAFYLAHFPVVRPDKQTTKVRIVFDGKQKFYNKSLNDAIHKGPNLSNCLFSVLLRFRKNPIAIIGDIKQMFLQVSMAPEDRHYHRFLYRKNPKDDPTEYQWCRHPFGNSGSPFVCQFVMRQQAELFREKYPDVVDMLYNSTVVDDTLLSVKSEEEAIRIVNALIEIYGGGQWDIRKFASNCFAVMLALPPEKRAPQMMMNANILDGDSANVQTGALGLKWSPETDAFTFRFAKAKRIKGKWSKRALLTTQASVFDPLGQLSPFVQKARMLQQELWREKYGWDDAIAPEYEERWHDWTHQLDRLPEIQFQRCLQPAGQVIKEELHTFSDASITGYGAACYLLTEYDNGDITVNLAMAKSRVVPVKPDTVPRLELRAAVLGADLWKLVSKALEVSKTNGYFWTDSGAVLAWIKTPSKALKMFVANRTLHIQDITDMANWRWTPTDQNPADLISRGADLEEFAQTSLWLHGPEYLKTGEYPDQSRVQVKSETLTEIKKEVLDENPELEENPEKVTSLLSKQVDRRVWRLAAVSGFKVPSTDILQKYLPNPEKYSSWTKLVRITTTLLKVLNVNRLDYQTARQWATNLLIRREQEKMFSEEIKALKGGNLVTRRSRLARMDPFVDEQGMLRMTSRLEFNEDVPDDMKYPIILPRSHLGQLVIHHYHSIRCLHLGHINQTLATLRGQYHVHGGRQEVKSVLNRCQKCKKIRPHIARVPEGALPNFRMPDPGLIKVFQKTSMDVAGPQLVRSGKRGRPAKRYFLIFTCMVTRAVVLEALENLNLPTFFMAFDRFLAEHPKPDEVLSDNYSTFRSANKIYKDFAKILKQGDLQSEYPEIKWHFTPPHTPRYNSVTERLIAIVKKGIKSSFTSYVPNDLEFRTMLKKVQKVMNDRPLSYVTPDNNEPLPLTPNHFIIGRISAMIVPTTEKMPKNLGRRYELLQKALTRFTDRFHKEIVPLYHEHRRPRNQRYANLQEGDVVMAIDPNPAKKGEWHIGRIVETEESQDGVVRKAMVFFPGKEGSKGTCLKRHVDKLALLAPHRAKDESDVKPDQDHVNQLSQ